MVAVVKLRYAINFAIAFEGVGGEPLKLLKAVNISERMLQDPELMIAESQLWTLAGEAAIRTGNFNIGFDAAAVSSLEVHGAMRQLYSEKTLSERLAMFCKMAKLEYSKADFFVRPSWNGIMFGRKRIVGGCEQVRQVELYVLQLMLETIRSVLGTSWVPTRLDLQSDHHPDLEWLAQSPETKLRFAQPVTEIHIDRRDLVSGINFGLVPATDDDAATSRRAVSMLVYSYLSDPRLSLNFIARMLAVSERSLQRELRKEGISFSQILARERIKSATKMLKDPDLSISEVSKSLGYSNQAHLTRAFIRSTGMTPSEFRRRS